MDAYQIYKVFVKINNGTADELVKFHKEFFNYDFKPRKLGLLDVPDSAIQNGDVFALHIMSPHETYDWMLTGSHSGHVAIAFRIDGAPYVFETTDAHFIEPGPPYGFHMTPFKSVHHSAIRAELCVAHVRGPCPKHPAHFPLRQPWARVV